MSLRKGLIIFILLAFGMGALIIFRSVDRETIRSLLAADKLKLLLALYRCKEQSFGLYGRMQGWDDLRE